MNNVDLKPSLIDLEVGDTTTGGKQDNISVQPERLSGKDQIYTVYWIRLENHKDIYSEGYVGITINFKERLKSHRKNRKKTKLKDTINKYGWNNLIKEIICENLTKEEALKLEAHYRPNMNVGWNLQKGGEIGVESEWYLDENNRNKHSINTSIGTKLGISLKDSTEKRSIRAKLSRANNLSSYHNINRGENNSRAILKESEVKIIKYELIPSGKSNREIADMYEVKIYVIAQIRNNKNWKYV